MPTRVSRSTSRRRSGPPWSHDRVADVEYAVGVVQAGSEKHGPQRERGGYARRHDGGRQEQDGSGQSRNETDQGQQLDLPRGLFQSGSTNRKDREEGKERLHLLQLYAHPGDAEVDLLGRLGRPLVDQPEQVAESSTRLALRHNPESYLVAHQKERHAEFSCTAQEPIELGERRLVPRRDPQGKGVEQDRIPFIRRFQYFVQVTDLQRAPPTRPSLPVEPYAPLQILVSIHDGGCHVEDTLASQ